MSRKGYSGVSLEGQRMGLGSHTPRNRDEVHDSAADYNHVVNRPIIGLAP